MKKVFVTLILLISSAAVFANPLVNIPGIVSFSENTTVYFNNEANAINWLEKQADFMAHHELSDALRRIMEATMRSMVPNWTDIVRLHSDYAVMVVRSPEPGHSSLSLYVRGELKRMWTY